MLTPTNPALAPSSAPASAYAAVPQVLRAQFTDYMAAHSISERMDHFLAALVAAQPDNTLRFAHMYFSDPEACEAPEGTAPDRLAVSKSLDVTQAPRDQSDPALQLLATSNVNAVVEELLQALMRAVPQYPERYLAGQLLQTTEVCYSDCVSDTGRRPIPVLVPRLPRAEVHEAWAGVVEAMGNGDDEAVTAFTKLIKRGFPGRPPAPASARGCVAQLPLTRHLK